MSFKANKLHIRKTYLGWGVFLPPPWFGADIWWWESCASFEEACKYVWQNLPS
jgi:hypothetical protein